MHSWDSHPNQPDTKVPIPEAQEIKKGLQLESYQAKRKGEENGNLFTRDP